MPAELFRALTSRPHAPGHRLGAFPISLLTHGTLIAVAITIPLLATDKLPRPPVHLDALSGMPVVPLLPANPPAPYRPAVNLVATGGAPVVAPQGVHEETGLVPTPTRAVNEDDIPIVGTVGGAFDRVSSIVEAAPPVTPKPTGPVRVGVVEPPRKLYHQAPVYPPAALAARIQGTVVIEAIIDTDGAVQNARVVQSVPLLDRAALEAVRQWKYTPTRLGGVPVSVIMTVQVEFRLQ